MAYAGLCPCPSAEQMKILTFVCMRRGLLLSDRQEARNHKVKEEEAGGRNVDAALFFSCGGPSAANQGSLRFLCAFEHWKRHRRGGEA